MRRDSESVSTRVTERRDFLKKAAVAGAIVWTAPQILSRPAYAVEGGGGTAKCRPSFEFGCVSKDCVQGKKFFPAITVTPTLCPCAQLGDPPPKVCLKFGPITADCGANVAYGGTTECQPNGPPDVIFTPTDWQCSDPTNLIYFGRPRSGDGSIPAIPTDCHITFTLGVWVGNCRDLTSGTHAYTCHTYDVDIRWAQSTSTATCTFTLSATTYCTQPGSTAPCTCP